MYKKRYYYNGKRCSKGEKKIIDYLNTRHILFKKEYVFDDCVSLTDHKLRFDFYLPEYELIIEFQGNHHYKPVNKYRRAKRVHEQTKIHDQIKKKYLDEHAVPLIEIFYKDYEKIEAILDQLLE